MDHVLVNTADLTGPALNWAVACIEGLEAPDAREGTPPVCCPPGLCDAQEFEPSTNWAQAGLLIDKWKIDVATVKWPSTGEWVASMAMDWLESEARRQLDSKPLGWFHHQLGPTAQVAAMRCLVVSQLGPEVKIPAIIAAAS